MLFEDLSAPSQSSELDSSEKLREARPAFRKMQRPGALVLTASLFLCPLSGVAAETNLPETGEPVQQLNDMLVTEKIGSPGVSLSPTGMEIKIQAQPRIGVPNSVVDVLKGQAIVDFRGESSVDAGVDSVYLRGFDASRFVTALDGLTVQKAGGRKSSNIVDYSQLPAFLIDSVEVLPGPHSALYDSKSIGGGINFKARRPERRDTLRPEGKFTTSYASYDTQTHNLSLQGAVKAVTYDLGYQHRESDGYLRNNAVDTDNLFGRLGLILPGDGFVTVSASYTDNDRQAPVSNTGADFDSSYPEVQSAAFAPYAMPVWDGISTSYRVNYEQNSPIGRLSGGAYTSYDNRDRAYYAAEGNSERTHMDTRWWSRGGKLMDEWSWSADHATTLGFDLVQLYDDAVNEEKTERVNKKGAFTEHRWTLLPSLEARLGLRYEKVNIWVTNFGVIPNREDIIAREWDALIPKSFLTWQMDQTADWLRDTSLALGVSRIWHAPDYHGIYNPQGKPAGAWLEPEHGMGYDLVLSRRLLGDITLKADYAFYQIKDYIANNKTYANQSGGSAGNLRYSDYKINLEEVYRHGVDLELGGHLLDSLSFSLTYAWQKFTNQGDEPAGETALHMRAEHRVTAGLIYQCFENTTLMLDYYYQSKEITEISEEIAPDVWYFTQEENPAYSVVDVGVSQLLFTGERLIRDASLKFYINNILDEDYKNASGYAAADRTYGLALNVRF